MKRSPSPTPPTLRIVFAATALLISIGIGTFIDALASPNAAAPASLQAAGASVEPTLSRWPLAL